MPAKLRISLEQSKENLFFFQVILPITLITTIFGGKQRLSHKSGTCRIDSEQKTENILECIHNRHNFAVSKETT